MVGWAKFSWNLQLFFVLWDYSTTIKTSAGFTPFQLVYRLEATLPIRCEIPSLKPVVELLPNTTTEEERFLYFNKLDETHQDATLANEVHKRWIKYQYNRSIQPRIFNEGDLVLTYDQKHDKLGGRKLESMWHGPNVVSRVLEKGAFELIDYDGIPLGEPWDGIYLKRYYA